jgi:N-acetylglucosaminyldiphosphoundecaprenol N-acetyl-beta-D-mannosaminyltransferase
MLTRQRLFGFDFISERSFDVVVSAIASGDGPTADTLPLVVTPNVDDVVRLSDARYADLAAATRRARFVLPDGQPIVLASRLLGRPLAARLPGSSLFPLLWEELRRQRRRVMFIAPSELVGSGLAAEYDALAYVISPFFDADDPCQLAEAIGVCAALFDEVQPEFVLLGIGFPKQQRLALGLIDHHAGRQPSGRPPLFLLLGGSFEMHLGLKRRAPAWVQRAGLEWFFRFLQQPRRLFRRYFVTDLKFLPIVWREWRAGRAASA